MKKLATAAAIGAALALVGAPLAASADPWPVDDTFTVGDAAWEFDEYGIAYGYAADGTYSSDGYLYYPGYFYDDTDYAYCADYENSTVTTLDNGDITIDCAASEFVGMPGVFGTMHFRIFATESNGYLLRFQLDVENTTGADVTPTVLDSYFDIDQYVTPDPLTADFTTSSGQTAAIGASDTWFAAGSNDGSTAFWTSAWAATGATTPLLAFGSADDGVVVAYNGVTFPANSTTHILQFANMVLPAEVDEASAATAFATAQAQTAEYADFCGRLSTGLAEGDYLGWGNPADCVEPVKPALADTGVDGVAPAVAGGMLVLLGGFALIVAARRRACA